MEMEVGYDGVVGPSWLGYFGSTGCGGVKYRAKPMAGDSQKEEAEKPAHSTQEIQSPSSFSYSKSNHVACAPHLHPHITTTEEPPGH